jgi:hypothetical protein
VIVKCAFVSDPEGGGSCGRCAKPRSTTQHAKPEPVLDAAPGDDGLDPVTPEQTAVLVVVIATTGEQAVGLLARPSALAF